MNVPFFRPSLGDAEINEVTAVLRSGWLTTGPLVKRFEAAFAAAVGGRHAIAVNSATAALHLAIEALGLSAGDGVLVPAMTFAATAEVVRYLGGVPILVDCNPDTLNIDGHGIDTAMAKLRSGRFPASIAADIRVVGLIPVHVGGLMVNMREMQDAAGRHGLWIVEDAAHAFPAAWRPNASSPWLRCGENSSAVSCFSFYANKTITTGEGGMAVTDDDALAQRMRLMSLHGLSHDAWGRYRQGGYSDYQIVAPGFKYNLTDIAAAIGVHQVASAENLSAHRSRIAHRYLEAFRDADEIDLPPEPADRQHSWHLFPIRLRLDRLSIDRDTFMGELANAKIGCSVHWRPLHLHQYYEATFGWTSDSCPIATREWCRLISLPIFPSMSEAEQDYVIHNVYDICRRARRSQAAS
jgi:dTDP-4-amino-4,6-dideoxygalactose transaminase